MEARIAEELSVGEGQVTAAVGLLDGGATVPFVARYRKEATGGLDDSQLRDLEDRLRYLREFEERRETVLESIRSQGRLDAELEARIRAADSKARLEDIYLPYKPKRRTKAQIAREAGLEPLADTLLTAPDTAPEEAAAGYVDPERGVATAQEALRGARAILTERFGEDADLLGELRERIWTEGRLTARVREGKEEAGAKFSDYFDWSEALTTLPSHRVLAVLRAEREEILEVTLDPGPTDADAASEEDPSAYERAIAHRFGIANRGRPADAWLLETVRWAWRTRLLVHLSLDLRGRLRNLAEDGAVAVFAGNLRDLLLAAPAGTRATMGLDPGLRTGVKVAVVDATGQVADTATVHPHAPRRQWDQALDTLAALVRRHGVELVAVGNGTASRETDRLAADLLARLPDLTLAKTLVSEAGASVYSASAYASSELPDLDVSLRGAVSIARRLQDPLAELVKIDPKSIGVGQYQHDVSEVKLSRSLDAVVEDCVNGVGVDVNTASAPLLARVSGISATLAGNIVSHRNAHGPFRSRRALREVPRLGPKAFEQAAGFLRVRDGDDALDGSAVHPEAYPVVRRMAGHVARPVPELIGHTEVLRGLRAADFVDDSFGLPTVQDILRELEKPGRDPRPAFRTARFKEGVEKLSDLRPGMVLEGVVSNVAAFGAFVDVGVHQDGLVHVSAMSRTFVSDPRQVVGPGDVVTVKVLDVDEPRKRIALTLRLDDEAAGGTGEGPGGERPRTGGGRGAPRQRDRDGRRGGGNAGGNRGGGGGQRRAAPPANSAMADALRRAGLAGPDQRRR